MYYFFGAGDGDWLHIYGLITWFVCYIWFQGGMFWFTSYYFDHILVLFTEMWENGSTRFHVELIVRNLVSNTHSRLMALCVGLPGWASTREVKTNLDFTEARDSEWQWHQLGHMQVCTSLQADNLASTPPLSFLQAGCHSCRPTNSVKELKAVF